MKLKMNVVNPQKEKIKKSTIIIYIIVALVCVLAIIVLVETQMFGNDIVNELFGINKIVKKDSQDEATLKENFDNIFDNTLEGGNNDKLVYTDYSKVENINNSEVNVNLPYIDIDNDSVKNFNDDIKDTFEAKTEQVIQENVTNTIYTVKYKAVVDNDILSLMIRSDLKQGNSPQRQIVQTFNYDLKNNKELSLEDIANKYNLNPSEIQTKINLDIKNADDKSKELKNLGYDVYSRDINSDIYKVKNISEFFIYKNNIYVIFAYGNNKLTSEMDIVII